MKSIKRGLCGLLAALLFTASAGHVHARFVALGHVDLSFYEVTANVVQLILERLGYNVGVQKGSHGQIYPLLGNACGSRSAVNQPAASISLGSGVISPPA